MLAWEPMDGASMRMCIAWDAAPPETRPRPWQPPPIQEDVRAAIETLESRMLFGINDDGEGGSLHERAAAHGSIKKDSSEAIPFRRVGRWIFEMSVILNYLAYLLHLSQVTVQPMQKISIPRAFLEDNFDVEVALKEGLQVQVLAEGHELDTDIDNLFLYKYQVRAFSY